jgi:hypothetical protein
MSHITLRRHVYLIMVHKGNPKKWHAGETNIAGTWGLERFVSREADRVETISPW